jgi:hypothetical protein
MNGRSFIKTQLGATENLSTPIRQCWLGLAVLGVLVAIPKIGAHADDQSPIAAVTSQNGKVRVEILSLKRMEGNTVQLRWRVVNDDNQTYKMTTMNERLIDMAARREYSPGLGSNCWTDPDQRLVCWAVFAAPPATTKSMTVHFYETLDLVPGVPVSE